MKPLTLVAGVASLAGASATTYFKETFDAEWTDRWTVSSEWKSEAELGKWEHTKGKYGVDEGVQTSQDARFYGMSAPLTVPFDNQGKDLVLSYTVTHEQELDCGGAYIKLLPPGFDAKKFGGDTPYAIMFGPDVCGHSTRKTHVIFTYKGENLLTKKSVRCETDRLPHRYTLIVHPDNTYEVLIDEAKVESGSLPEDWDFLPPKTIKDPKAKKPSDWVDEAEIPDPADVKPAGYDDVPAQIPDPNAKMPEDWDAEEDGEWETPMIPNPEYKGEWKPKMIPNTAYKGPWVHPEVPNPKYKEDNELYHVCKPCAAVGFELWQVKAGTIFDDIIVTDSIEEANAFAKETFLAKKDAEKRKFDELEAEKKAEAEKAAKEAEEQRKAAEAAAKSSEGEDDEEKEKEDL